MRVALDLETECAVTSCPGHGGSDKCDHALDEYRNRITVVGVAWKGGAQVFRDLDKLRAILSHKPNWQITGHNIKFDIRQLLARGIDVRPYWTDDSMLMAAVSLTKVPNDYLIDYEMRRQALDGKHRKAGPNSLKVLAPYFLGIEPFWEVADKDDDEYVLKDCRYTLQLTEFFERNMSPRELTFYRSKMIPWTSTLISMEMRGISIDLNLLAQTNATETQKALSLSKQLDELWAPAHRAYSQLAKEAINKKYDAMTAAAVAKSGEKARPRYTKLREAALAKAPEKLSLDSPAQLMWLFRDHMGLDVTDFDGEETTGKAVLQRLAETGRQDIETFNRYRQSNKILTSFLPAYLDKQVNGIIHCNFNPTGARTGRISSSSINMQQVSRGLHHLFVARPGYKLITKDESAIEPRLLAHYSQDPKLLSIFKEGKDFHNENTALFFDLNPNEPGFKKLYSLERDVGKEVGLAIIYGAGIKRYRESAMKRGFKKSTLEATTNLARFQEYYRGVFSYRDGVVNKTLAQGPLFNLFGRPIKIQDHNDIYMKGLNTLIQSTASDLVWNSAHRAQEQFNKNCLDAHILLLVHDEIVVEASDAHVEQANSILEHCMTDYKLDGVALKVEGKISQSWEK